MIIKRISAAFLFFTAVLSGCEKATVDVDTTLANGSVAGEISGVWPRGSVQIIKGDVVVPEGKSLTIEEGVTVLMDTVAKPEFIVMGNLYSMGTEEHPVKFTVYNPEGAAKDRFGHLWGGILAGQSCTELVLDHTILEYGGATTTDASTSVKMGLYKHVSGQNLPALWFANADGKLIVVSSTIRNFQEDCTYIEGGSIIFANNYFYTTGVSGGEAMNFKSGCHADIAYNTVYSANTNALKLSNSGEKTPQTHIIAYNNTMINTGWRRPTAKGGSVWLESTVRADLFNNLFANTRFGIKRDTKKPEDSRSSISNNLYYGYDQTTVNQFQPTQEVVGGVNEIRGTTAGENDPKFVNYPLNTNVMNADFDKNWDFHLQPGSPALNKGKTNFTRHFAEGLVVNGNLYASPAPANYIGAFGAR